MTATERPIMKKKSAVVIPIDPCPKPRMTQRDKWKKRPIVERYYLYKDQLNLLVRGELDARFSVVFKIAMPQSWSEVKKVRYDGRPHTDRPDIDNYLKAFLDALCSNDSYVYDVRAEKYWTREGSIELTERGN